MVYSSYFSKRNVFKFHMLRLERYPKKITVIARMVSKIQREVLKCKRTAIHGLLEPCQNISEKKVSQIYSFRFDLCVGDKK